MSEVGTAGTSAAGARPAPGNAARDEAGREYASGGRRALAALIDNVVWLVFYLWIYGSIVAVVDDESPAVARLLVFAYLSLWFNYYSFAEWRWGQTIGKNATGIMVASSEPGGGPITFAQASMRGLLRLLDWLIGWFLIGGSPRGQRLGDRVAKTVVVRRPKGTGSVMRGAAELSAMSISAAATPAGDEPNAGAPIAPAGIAPSEAPGGEVLGADAPEPGDVSRPGLRGRLPDINWTLGNTIRGLFAGLLLAIFTPILVIPFDSDLESDGGLLVAQALFGASLLIFPLGHATHWSIRRLREALPRLGVRRFALSGLGWMLLAMFAYYLFAGLFATLVFEPEQEDIGGELGVGDENVLVAVSAVVLIVGLAAVAEEIFFRGFVFSGLRSRLSLWPAAVISGLVFGLVHAATGITAVIPLAVFGVALAWLYDRTGSLWPSMIAHSLNNGIALAYISAESTLSPPF